MLKTFFSENSRYIVKYFINQIIMSFLGLCIGLPTIILKNTVVSIIGCIFSIAMLCFLQYDFAFHLGEKHCYLPEDQQRPKKSLGIKIALVGTIPTFLVIFIGFIFRLTMEKVTVVPLLIYYGLNGTYVQLYALINSGVGQMSNLVLSGCIMWGFCLLFTLPGILSCGLGYYLGSIDKPFRVLLGIRKEVKVKRDNR